MSRLQLSTTVLNYWATSKRLKNKQNQHSTVDLLHLKELIITLVVQYQLKKIIPLLDKNYIPMYTSYCYFML